MNFFKDIWQALNYFLFPPRCPSCRKIVDERYQFCPPCLEKILSVDFYDSPPPPLEKVLRVTKYRDGSRELLHKLKFDNNLRVLPPMKKILDDVSNREEISTLLNGIDFAVPVPLHQGRFKERGFNQTEKIFEDFLLKKNLPPENLLIRTQPTPKLYNLNKTEREKILSGVFAPAEEIDLRGKNILIVDDIFTTGTTCRECAKVLKSLGAEKISVLAFAHYPILYVLPLIRIHFYVAFQNLFINLVERRVFKKFFDWILPKFFSDARAQPLLPHVK